MVHLSSTILALATVTLVFCATNSLAAPVGYASIMHFHCLFSLTDNVGMLVNSVHEIDSETPSVAIVDSMREIVRDARVLE